ncbi:MAG TPA: hypothetical protein DDY78_09440 [Planctomycetales bacterium]|jgi:hypothetical protein|nr:hypothetical protein [Planctomycetales bacterium]
MKRTILFLLVLTATGCVELPIRPEPNATYKKATKAPAPEAAMPKPVMGLPSVAPDQVSDDNAPQVLDALREEMDRAASERSSSPKP